MGYHTDFGGSFVLDRPLTTDQRAYLTKFAETRRMKRAPTKASLLPDPLREAVGLPIGDEGAYFVGGTGYAGQDDDGCVVDHNCPPKGQPGLWCQWIPNDDGTEIEWDGGEKFYEYIYWIEYLIDHFLKPWGYVLNGVVGWYGDDRDDMGKIIIKDNVVSTKYAVITWED